MHGVPIEALERLPLFADLTQHELAQYRAAVQGPSLSPRARRSSRRARAARPSSSSSPARRQCFDRRQGTLDPEGRRLFRRGRPDRSRARASATIVAATELACYGLTYWDFRPFVEQNGTIGWKLLERMAMMLRDARKG